MPENKNSFIKSKMNKDLDERLLPNNEYRDASNVAISRSEGSDVGALESILGNIQVFTEDPEMGRSVIGYLVDESNGFIYHFSTFFDGGLSDRPSASAGQMGIYRFDTNTNNNIILVEGSFLNFSLKYPIHGINLMENLLFWSDNRNQPRKINIDIAAGNSSYYTTEDQISVCKFSPYTPIDFINLRSPLATQPSTLTRQQNTDSVNINDLKWTDTNLDVTSYANGDPIPQVTDPGDWAALTSGAWCYYDNDDFFSGLYGKLYNKYAVNDTTHGGLAPLGFTVATEANWADLRTFLGAATAGEQMKTLKQWPFGEGGTNAVGFNGTPGGYRKVDGTFDEKLETAGFWNADDINYQELSGIGSSAVNDALTTKTDGALKEGRSVRVIQDPSYQWAGDPEFLSDKFVKFSYRFKFNDNEYSIIAPFSQDCFIPQQNGEFGGGTSDTDAAFRTTVVEFMQNNINNAILNITLPSKDIITDYKIKELDIIFKESDGLAYQVLETIDIDTNFISNLNNTNIFQYDYQSTIPFKTLPQTESSRVYDKVPVRALAQESSANRIIYGNFIQSYTAPLGLDYYVDVDEKSLQTYTEYRNHSVKQNRNYQVGIILADKYGRETDVVLSNYDSVLNADDNPQPGSNLYNPYKSSAFTTDIEAWMGDNLKLEFNNMIPEGENASGLSGFPGTYAQGNYYITTSSETGAYFNNNSTEEITAPMPVTGSYTIFTFNGLLNDDVSGNTLNVYVNASNGWILQTLGASDDYTVTSTSGNPLEITFATALADDNIAKAEILFGATEDYKFSVNNMFDSFTTTSVYQDIFGTTGNGKYLRGLYKDYTQITYVNKDGSDIITIKTKDEIAKNYIFPVGTGTPKTNATYDINPNGFYTYRVAVKQQQQEYYNVYLPGIVNGYPIVSDTSEQGETAFITLVSDNINKIPRNLQEVGPLDDQFNSDTRMWGRVTNTSDGKMEQYFPNTNSDKVDLIGTVTDVFPLMTTTSTPAINDDAIFDYVSRPNLGKISTEATIGVKEDQYTSATPYPTDMNLAVYETAPVMSAIELFWETSTAGLISDVNYNIKNNTTEITGTTVEAAAGGFDEADATATTITNPFYPTALIGTTPPSINVTDTTATLLSVCSKYKNGILNPNNRSSDFVLVPHASNGSYEIDTVSTFYAGEDNATANFFEFTIQFTQSDGVLVNQSYNTTLTNIEPVISLNDTPLSPDAGTDVEIFNSITPVLGTTYGPTGTNGSANPSEYYLFPSQTGAGWTITELFITPLDEDEIEIPFVSIGDYFTITRQGQIDAGTGYGFQVKSVSTYTLVTGTVFKFKFALKDAGGLQTETGYITLPAV